MRYIMKPTFEPGALTGLKAHNVEEAWNTLVRMTGFDPPAYAGRNGETTI